MNSGKHLSGAGLGLLVALGLPMAAQAQEEEVPAPPDIIELKDGSRILGTVTETRDGVLTIATSFSDGLDIELDKIASVKTAEPVTIQLVDDTVVTEQPLVIEDEMLVVDVPGPVDEEYDLDEILVVNPEPWELGYGYKWTGTLSFSLVNERGNTDTDDLYASVNSVWRSVEDRYTLDGNATYAEANGEKTSDDWFLSGKYDYFLEDPWYVGLLASAEHDEFTDLDLRYIVGPYVGYQFFDEPIFSLSGEVGASYVNEDFIVAEDNDYPAANWAINASSDYLGSDSRMYLNHRGIINLDETSDYILNTTLGVAFPLLWGLEAAGEVSLDYDNGAVEGVDELDQTYRFRVGYTW